MDEPERALRRADEFAADLLGLAQVLMHGDITVMQFMERLRDMLSLYFWAMAVIATGDEELEEDEWEVINEELARQEPYLMGFARDLEAGLVSTAALRAAMYGLASAVIFWRLWTKEKGERLMEWVLNPAVENCATCLEREGVRYPANALPFHPRDGSTLCLTRCYCMWVPVE